MGECGFSGEMGYIKNTISVPKTVEKNKLDFRKEIIEYSSSLRVKSEDFLVGDNVLAINRSNLSDVRLKIQSANCSNENRKKYYNEVGISADNIRTDELKKRFALSEKGNGMLMESVVSMCLPLWFSEEKSFAYRTTDYDDIGGIDRKGVDMILSYKMGDNLSEDSVVNFGIDITSNVEKGVDVLTGKSTYDKLIDKIHKHLLLCLDPEKKGKFIKYGYDKFNNEKKPMTVLPLVVGFSFEEEETQALIADVFSLVEAKKQYDGDKEQEIVGKIKNSSLKYVLQKEIEDQLKNYSNYGLLSKNQSDFLAKVKKATKSFENKINVFDKDGNVIEDKAKMILKKDWVWRGIRHTINNQNKEKC